jgi:hypothetical protein
MSGADWRFGIRHTQEFENLLLFEALGEALFSPNSGIKTDLPNASVTV